MDFRQIGVCIDIVDICFRSANSRISSIFDRVICPNTSVFYFQDNNLSKSQWIFTKFDMCFDIMEICFGIAHWQISSIFDRVICPRHNNVGYYRFTLYYMFICIILEFWLHESSPGSCVYSLFIMCLYTLYHSSGLRFLTYKHFLHVFSYHTRVQSMWIL